MILFVRKYFLLKKIRGKVIFYPKVPVFTDKSRIISETKERTESNIFAHICHLIKVNLITFHHSKTFFFPFCFFFPLRRVSIFKEKILAQFFKYKRKMKQIIHSLRIKIILFSVLRVVIFTTNFFIIF